MSDRRAYLPAGSQIELEPGHIYQIIGQPIGHGGSSIIYPAHRLTMQRGKLQSDGFLYVLKECYPSSASHSYTRNHNGEIIPQSGCQEAGCYLHFAQANQLAEGSVSRKIYQTASRILPIREASQTITLTLPGKTPAVVSNTVTILESLSEKGRSLTTWLEERRHFSPIEAFRILQQLLFSLQEVHQAGYLHLDIQDGNVFLRGTLENNSELVTLIDFGSARPMQNGQTPPIQDRIIFTTQGFSAPEILLHNDGTLQLGVEADIYSAGCLTLYLLTGQRPDSAMLLTNRSGIYLKPNQLRRMKCPRHLVDRIQQILARALEKEPENRYHSADEMLADVGELISALQPYRTDLSCVKYDAFICYKHGPIDSAAALFLQKQLESFRPPKGISQQKNPFNRVFVDEGELSSCSDFGQQIREALRNSGWLIVVCSPDTPTSPWVQLEIETFLETHSRSRVLCVMTGGDEKISFPPQLRGIQSDDGEVLAADARGDTFRKVAKKLRADALLKLAAPMLGTTFDSLKQRRKIHMLQRAAGITAGFLLSAVGFATYALNRANVIAQQAVQIEEEYEKALINESRFLTELARKQLDNSNPIGAMELALRALPSAEQDRPVLTEAEFVLGEAIGIYRTPASTEFSASVTGTIDTGYSEYFLDPTGKYLIAWQQEGDVQIWDTQTHLMLRTIPTQTLLCFTDEALLIPDSSSLILQMYPDSICCVDYTDGMVIWQRDYNALAGEELITLRLSDDGTVLLAFFQNYQNDSWKLEVIASDTGKTLQQLSFSLPADEKISLYDDFWISEDRKWIVFPTTACKDVTDTDSAGIKNKVYRIGTETGTPELLVDQGTTINSASLFADHFAIMHATGGELEYYAGGSKIYSVYPFTMWFEVYDLKTGEPVWRTERSFFPKGAAKEEIQAVWYQDDGLCSEGLLFAYSDQIILVDRNTGQLIREFTLSDAVVDIWYFDDSAQILTQDGTLTILSYNDNRQNRIQKVMGDSVESCRRSGYSLFIRSQSSDRIIKKFQMLKYDESYLQLYEAENDDWYLTGFLTDDNSGEITALVFDQENCLHYVDLVAGTVRDYPIPASFDFSDSFLSDDGESIYWYSGNSYDHTNQQYYRLDLDSGKIQEIRKPREWEESLFINEMLFDGSRVFFTNRQYGQNQTTLYVYVWNLAENTVQKLYHETSDLPDTDFLADSFFISHIANQLSFVIAQDDQPKKLIRVNLDTNYTDCISIAFPVETGDGYSFNSKYCSWNRSGSQAAFATNGNIYIAGKDGERQCCIPTEEIVTGIAFSPDGACLYVFFENGTISMYRTADGILLDSISLNDDSYRSVRLYKDALTWEYVEDSLLLVYASYTGWTSRNAGGFLLDVSNEALCIKAQIEECLVYLPQADKFLAGSGSTTIGTFPRYSTEDLIQKAQAILYSGN